MTRISTATIGVSLIATLALTGAAKKPTSMLDELGTLTCRLGAKVSTDTDAARAQEMVCLFRNADASTDELYTGTAYFIDPPGGAEAEGSLSWIVKGTAETASQPGGLAQTFTAQHKKGGAGDAVATLIGDRSSNVALHALNVPKGEGALKRESATQVNIVDLKLKSTAT